MDYIGLKFNNIVIVAYKELLHEPNTALFINHAEIYYLVFIFFNLTNNANFHPNMKLKKKDDIVIRVLAGDGIDCDNGTHRQFCSVGFLAKDDKNFNYIGIAEHCYLGKSAFYNLDPWNSTTPIFLGQLVMNNLGLLGFGLIIILRKNIIPILNIRNTGSGQYPKLLIEDDIAVSSNSAYLCLSAYIHMLIWL
ncbi:hypothetical protein F8M41_004687 [Gigaspora margarita]|uniref:Uncharacterized protein n=1 Tax=Gigaspora margarita TaxID=4874 RepID=A0A8H4AXL0_GIGMA|nr:hypothetical protein F8M41_004687 [Gigaspora margarita]